jgi:hypothetical protein
MWVTRATVPILPGAAVNQERSYASYPQSRHHGSSGTVVATRLSTSGLSPERLFSPTHLKHALTKKITDEPGCATRRASDESNRLRLARRGAHSVHRLVRHHFLFWIIQPHPWASPPTDSVWAASDNSKAPLSIATGEKAISEIGPVPFSSLSSPKS